MYPLKNLARKELINEMLVSDLQPASTTAAHLKP